MISSTQNLLMLFNREAVSEKELNCLNNLLLLTDSPEHFCTAHELVNRNHITSKRRKLLKESRQEQLRPFRFLVNKN